MGIPRLKKLLQPYAESTVLGCKTTGCEEHPDSNQVIIDGPSLAYHIYDRLLAHKHSDLCPMDAVPSYDDLGIATLTFLDELQSHRVLIKRIFFDGAITPQRAKIRKSRLEVSLRHLVDFHDEFSDGFKIRHGPLGSPLDIALQVFDSTRFIPFARQVLPASAFLVPAVLDALRTSEYASITSVVPGEADLYCARVANESGGIILTNDSDLLVYDLGESGAVLFLSQLELRKVSGQSTECGRVLASVSRPSQIASRLDLKDFKDLAFVISQKAMVTLPKAIRLAKEPLEVSATRAFDEGYDISLSYSELMTTSKMSFGADVSTGQYLDPRISEIASQSPLPSFIFLPFLIDDPSRASAWKVSRTLRTFAYSLFIFRDSETCLEKILEYGRRGTRIMEDNVALLSSEKTLAFANVLVGTLDRCKRLFSRLPEDGIWRLYALREVINWYIDEGKEPPLNSAMIRVFLGAAEPHLFWNDIHLSAQIEAVLCSLRMISQILNHLKVEAKPDSQKAENFQNAQGENCIDPDLSSLRLTESPNPLPAELVTLETILAALPLLNELMPSRTELSARAIPAADIEHLLSILAASLPGHVAIGDVERTSDENAGIGVWSEKKARKGRKSRRRDEKGETVMDGGKRSNNMFDLLSPG